MNLDVNGNEIPPHRSVHVGISMLEYSQVCDVFGGGHQNLEAWKELGNLLANRVGWHFELVNWGDPLWSLGSFGESMLNIGISENGFGCFDYRDDESWDFDNISDVSDWVDAREMNARQLSQMSHEWLSANDWALLKSHTFDAQISTIEQHFLTEVDGVLEPGRMSESFIDAVQNARQLIIDFLSAPQHLAASISVNLSCDPTSVDLFLDRFSETDE